MSIRRKLDDAAAVKVAGGINVYNDFGDGSRYAFCPTGQNHFEYYYYRSDEDAIAAIIDRHNDPNLTPQQNDLAAYEEIIASEYAHPISELG